MTIPTIPNGAPAGWHNSVNDLLSYWDGGDAPASFGSARARLNAVASDLSLPSIKSDDATSVKRAKINGLIEAVNATIPDSASVYLDFLNGRYFGGNPDTSRSGSALMLGPDGYQSFPANTLARIDGVGAQVVPARANNVTCSSNTGAAPGTPGALPAGWQVSATGISQQVVGAGTERGVPYVDLRLFGTTAASTMAIRWDYVTRYVATNGEAWAFSVSLALLAGIQNFALSGTLELANSGAFLANRDVFFANSLTSSLDRYEGVATFANAGVNQVFAKLVLSAAVGTVVDFTLRIAVPQVERNASYASPPIITSGAAVSRPGDLVTAAVPVSDAGGIVGAYQMDWRAVESFKRHICFSDGSAANRVLIEIGSAGGPRWNGDLGGLNQGVGAIADSAFRTTGPITVVFGVSENFRALRVVGDTLRTDHGKPLPPGMALGGFGGDGTGTGSNTFCNFKKFAAELGPVNQTKFDKWFGIAQGWAS